MSIILSPNMMLRCSPSFFVFRPHALLPRLLNVPPLLGGRNLRPILHLLIRRGLLLARVRAADVLTALADGGLGRGRIWGGTFWVVVSGVETAGEVGGDFCEEG